MTNREAEIETRAKAIEVLREIIGNQPLARRNPLDAGWMAAEDAEKALRVLEGESAELRVARQETETLREALRRAESFIDRTGHHSRAGEEATCEACAIVGQLRAALASPVPGDET